MKLVLSLLLLVVLLVVAIFILEVALGLLSGLLWLVGQLMGVLLIGVGLALAMVVAPFILAKAWFDAWRCRRFHRWAWLRTRDEATGKSHCRCNRCNRVWDCDKGFL